MLFEHSEAHGHSLILPQARGAAEFSERGCVTIKIYDRNKEVRCSTKELDSILWNKWTFFGDYVKPKGICYILSAYSYF